MISTLLLGENPNRIFEQSRMDAQWNFRNAYNEAKKVKDAQDAFCEKVEAEDWDSLECEGDDFPENLEWEALVDVLRGKVKVGEYYFDSSEALTELYIAICSLLRGLYSTFLTMKNDDLIC